MAERKGSTDTPASEREREVAIEFGAEVDDSLVDFDATTPRSSNHQFDKLASVGPPRAAAFAFTIDCSRRFSHDPHHPTQAPSDCSVADGPGSPRVWRRARRATLADRSGEVSSAVTLANVPGLVMGLQHNLNQAPAGTVMFSALSTQATHRDGGDIGAPLHRGYEWWSLPDNGGNPASVRLPPGVVVALKHNANQSGESITSFGHDPVTGGDFTNFRRVVGGDWGASSGVGYFWYESTGAGFTDWGTIGDLLPNTRWSGSNTP